MKKKFLIAIGVPFLLLFCACEALTSVSDAITNPDAREIYKRKFKDNPSAYAQWDSIFQIAKRDSLNIPLPYGEKGNFDSKHNSVYSYTADFKAGEVLQVEIATDTTVKQVFIDIFEYENNEWKPVGKSKPNENIVSYPISNDAIFRIILQPEIGATGRFFTNISKLPSYGFPVAGKGNAAIGSFWADPRDGGKRSHEGIDIFAKRGTPVVAVTSGTVIYSGEKGIGGKQVWQRAGMFGNSIYYAHLDSIAVAEGIAVKTGDTLGFVGNTGNAKTTVPHLHFGIYRNHGAVDPKPFVFKTEIVKPETFPLKMKTTLASINKFKATLRNGPSTAYSKITELTAQQKIIVLGQHRQWLHVQTTLGQRGFLHESLVK